MEFSTALLFTTLALAYVFAIFTIPAWLIKRAMAQVISIFRTHAATEPRKARTREELGLRPPSFVDRIGRWRDYKPAALKFLMKAEVVRETFDRRVYLSERGLEILCERDVKNSLGLCRLVLEE